MDKTHAHDALDQILFDTAQQTTADMQLGAAWAQIQAEHHRNRRRKALVRYLPLAAMLVLGLGIGTLLAPLLQKKAYDEETGALQNNLPPAPGLEEQGGYDSMPDSMVVQGPNGPEDMIVMDPPKTSGPGVEEWIAGEVHAFPNLVGKAGIHQLYPAWLPDGLDTFVAELAGQTWYATGAADNALGYTAIHVSILPGTPGEDIPALDVGEGFPYYLRMEGEAEATGSEWYIRVREDAYLHVLGEYVEAADMVHVLEQMGEE